MYLKRLELQGYKTFAARTEFEFDSGVTAIVGPNGSGKSNIADALRWVMGEQRYSTLRAKRSEDMIFAGSQGRSSLGMAEVSLTLDNSNGWLPIDYSEVSIQRRAYRSGENEYYLNGSRVRLRDLVELLAKGGLSSNTYTVIGQGAVDASLGMRPEERRGVFEEAAGISLYQAKRDRSVAKLEDTRSNILRVNDIINEIAPRLESLRKQAERAEEYRGASTRLEEVLETWYGYRWRQAHERLKSVESKERNSEEALRLHRGKLEEISQKIHELRERQAELRGELGDWHSESGVLHGRLEGLQRELAVKRERQRLLIQQRDEIQQDVSPLLVSLEARVNRIGELEAELEGLANERQEREAQVEEVRKEIAQLQDERRRLEEELTAAQNAAFELATELADGRNRVAQLRERKEELVKESGEHEEAIRDLESQLAGLTEQLSDLEARRDAIIASMEELSAREAEKQGAARSSLEQQAELRGEWEEKREALGRLETRYDLLNGLRRDMEGYSQGVRTVLSRKKDLPGVVATVAELVDVPPHLESAVEAALGNLLQAVVVKTWEDAESALLLLEDSDGGRATLLPLDSLATSLPEDVPGGAGVLGLGSELIGIREGLRDVLDAILGHTLVVDDLALARSAISRDRSLQAVTLAGQLVSPRGLVTGGSAESGGGLLAREREWRELPEQIESLRSGWKALETQLVNEEEAHARLVAEIAALGEERKELEEAAKANTEEIASWRLRRDRVTQEIEWHTVAARRLGDETSSLEEREQAAVKEIEAAQRKEQETAEAMDSLQERLGASDVLALQGRLAGLRTSLAVSERTSQSQQAALEGHRASLEQLQAQIEAKESRVEELTGEAEQLESTVKALAAQIEKLSLELDGVSARIGPAEEELATLEQEQRRLEQEEVQGRKGMEDFEVAYNQSLLARQRREDELRNLQERIEADLEMVALPTDWPRQLPLDIDRRLASLPVVTEIPKGLDDEIKGLKRQLREMGPVNLDAPSEYQGVLERHSFLMGQVEDLEKAGQSLRKVVAELDHLMEEKFLETFSGVAAEFEVLFPRLFNGGKGKLLLIEPENPLGSGVEIIAQPPGRRPASVTMLSGGERALTGAALTLAILKTCEIPFCLLDEVDSRLDEINLGRFREALKELAEKTQVVIITHNRLTVEIADAIYGITMAGDSTSRVLSLRVDDVETKAS